VEQLKSCDNVTALARDLGIPRRTLYRWLDQLEPVDDGEAPPENIKERDLRIQLATAKRLLADKALEVDFFRAALQKIEARRQNNTPAGETASMTKSGS
jgi:transposase-like protein